MDNDKAILIVRNMRAGAFDQGDSLDHYMRIVAARVATLDGSVIDTSSAAAFLASMKASGWLDDDNRIKPSK